MKKKIAMGLVVSTVIVGLFLAGFGVSRYLAYKSDQEQLAKLDAIIEQDIADMEAAAAEAVDNAEENEYTDGDGVNYDVDAFAMFDSDMFDIEFLTQDQTAENELTGERVSISDVFVYQPEENEPPVKENHKVIAVTLALENIGTPATMVSTGDFNLVSFTESYERYGTKTFEENFTQGNIATQTIYFEIPEEVMSFDLQYISQEEAQGVDSGLTRLYLFALMIP